MRRAFQNFTPPPRATASILDRSVRRADPGRQSHRPARHLVRRPFLRSQRYRVNTKSVFCAAVWQPLQIPPITSAPPRTMMVPLALNTNHSQPLAPD